jgi:hypothetical protein
MIRSLSLRNAKNPQLCRGFFVPGTWAYSLTMITTFSLTISATLIGGKTKVLMERPSVLDRDIGGHRRIILL